MNIEKELKGIIETISERTFENLSGKNLFEDLEFDSIMIMELVVEVEKKFQINLGEDELIESISMFDNLLSVLTEKLS